MTLWQPTRRELLKSGPFILGSATLAGRLLGAPTKPLRFLVVGDWGRNGAAYQTWVAAQMAKRPGSFVVSTGDNFYLDGVSSVRDPQWDTSFERIYSPALGRWYAVLGNHDYGGDTEAQIERTFIPGSRWYMRDRWFDVKGADFGRPDVHLFFLDTVAWHGKEGKFWRLWGDSTSLVAQRKQKEWLEDKLSGSDARFKLVFGHHGIFSIGAHGGKTEMRELDDVLRRYGVAAYVHGHDHCMFHITHRGMNYVCSGAGSRMKPDYTGGEKYGCVVKGFCDEPGERRPTFPVWRAYFGRSENPQYDMQGGFADFTIDERRVSFTFVDGLGQERYTSHIALPSLLYGRDRDNA